MNRDFVSGGYCVRRVFKKGRAGEFTIRHTKIMLSNGSKKRRIRLSEFYTIERCTKGSKTYVSFTILVKRRGIVLRNSFTVEDTEQYVPHASAFHCVLALFDNAKRIEAIYERLDHSLSRRLLSAHARDVRIVLLCQATRIDLSKDDVYDRLLEIISIKTGYGLCD